MIAKDNAPRSRAYRMWCAEQDCIHCGSPAPTQAAHADEGKGQGIKAGDDRVFPLCATREGRRGCHDLMGASGVFTQWQRRHFEDKYVRMTQQRAIEQGAWPKDWPLPDWAKEAA